MESTKRSRLNHLELLGFALKNLVCPYEEERVASIGINLYLVKRT